MERGRTCAGPEMAASHKGPQLRGAREPVGGMGPASSRGAGGAWLLFWMTCHAPVEALALSENQLFWSRSAFGNEMGSLP